MHCCLVILGQLKRGSQTESVHVSICPFDCDCICTSVSVCMCLCSCVSVSLYTYALAYACICICLCKKCPPLPALYVVLCLCMCSYVCSFLCASLSLCLHLYVSLLCAFLSQHSMENVNLHASPTSMHLLLPSLISLIGLLHNLSLTFLHLAPSFLSNTWPPTIGESLYCMWSLVKKMEEGSPIWPLPFFLNYPESSPACRSKWFSIAPYLGSWGKRRAFFSSKKKFLVWAQACAARTHTHTHTTEREWEREKNIKVPSLLRQALCICCHGNPPTPSPKNHQEEVMALRTDWLISFFIIFFWKRSFYSKNRLWDPLALSCIALLGT